MTFDDILPEIKKILAQEDKLEQLGEILINRDLNGRVRLVLHESKRDSSQSGELAKAISNCLGKHGYYDDNIVLYESDLEAVKQGAPHFQLEGFKNVTVIDRLITESDWSNIVEPTSDVSRMVFFSIKGGVGRSTALAVAAWSLAQAGKRVLVLDLDLESPGLSSALLPTDRQPKFGITDWLVEDLVDNGNAVLGEMYAMSELSHDGEIYVVPAHGREPGEYIVKLGRAWMSKLDNKGRREIWSARLRRLIDKLENKYKPDVILMDSRAGIDEVAAACITELGAQTIFLFGIDGDQTWTGYDILFQCWRQSGKARAIRERLKMVAAMIPELNEREYFNALCERAYNIFTNALYDVIPAEGASGTEFNFMETDADAPHYPLPIYWHRGFFALQSLHAQLQKMDDNLVQRVFGSFLQEIDNIVNNGNAS